MVNLLLNQRKFVEIFIEQRRQFYEIRFDDHINERCQLMIISIIENKIKINFDEFSKEFQEFRRKQSFENDIEDFKFQAFQQFLKQYELIQTNSLMKCSIKVKEILKKKLDSLKETMKINLGFDFN